MNRTPDFERKKSKTLRPSIFGAFEDSKKVLDEKKKEAETGLKKGEERKKRNLESMKKLRIDLDKQIEIKQGIIENSLLKEKNLDQIMGEEIFLKLKIKGDKKLIEEENDKKKKKEENEDKKEKDRDKNKTKMVKAWVQEQKSKELKGKLKNMIRTPVKIRESLISIPEVRRSTTPINPPNPVTTKTISRQISNTIKKARELRSLISKSPLPVFYH